MIEGEHTVAIVKQRTEAFYKVLYYIMSTYIYFIAESMQAMNAR